MSCDLTSSVEALEPIKHLKVPIHNDSKAKLIEVPKVVDDYKPASTEIRVPVRKSSHEPSPRLVIDSDNFDEKKMVDDLKNDKVVVNLIEGEVELSSRLQMILDFDDDNFQGIQTRMNNLSKLGLLAVKSDSFEKMDLTEKSITIHLDKIIEIFNSALKIYFGASYLLPIAKKVTDTIKIHVLEKVSLEHQIKNKDVRIVFEKGDTIAVCLFKIKAMNVRNKTVIGVVDGQKIVYELENCIICMAVRKPVLLSPKALSQVILGLERLDLGDLNKTEEMLHCLRVQEAVDIIINNPNESGDIIA
jgi:hypothetical protein